MAARAGVGPLVGFAAAGSREEALVRQSVDAAAWHLGIEAEVVHSEAELRGRLEKDEPGLLLVLEQSVCIHDALCAGWVVVTSRRHRDARHGRELFWVLAQRPKVLVRALLHVVRLGPALAAIRSSARAVARSLTPRRFLARWAPPLVSVVMPAFNDQEELVPAMRSVLAQSVADLELILVDDGSTDASRGRSFEVGDSRVVRVWQGARGPSAARNTGLSLARAESYLAFLDSDDHWEPPFLERLLEALEVASPQVGLAFCDYFYSLDGGGETRRSVEDWSFPALVSSDGLIPTGAFVFRRRVLSRVGLLDADLARGEDYAWLLRVAASFEMARVPEALFHYRRSSSGQLLSTPPDSRRLEHARLEAVDAWAQRVLPRSGIP